MDKSQNTKKQIINSSLEVLRAYGTEGLTMRKVAAHAGMSLGNLQYHYKNKTELFSGLASYYFGQCAELLEQYPRPDEGADPEASLHALILFFMDHVDHLSDMCRIFREMWALSTRDAAIEQQLNEYYRSNAEQFESLLKPIFGKRGGTEQAVSLLLPYFEGYSITHDAMPQDKQEIARMLTIACLRT